jgi:hypothetical protein
MKREEEEDKGGVLTSASYRNVWANAPQSLFDTQSI